MNKKRILSENEKHFKTRFIIFVIIISLFTLYSLLFISSSQRSCLGNPKILLFVFFGIPIISILAITDLVYLIIVKKINRTKIGINLGIVSLSILSIFLLS